MSNAKLIALAREGCDTLMRKFAPEELPPVHHFHYHQGVFLAGVMETWNLTGEDRYFDYVKAWVDSLVDPFGNITAFNAGQLDDLQPGVLLFPLYERTRDERYRIAMDTIAYALEHFPRTPEGGFWHKYWYRNQMWLDGLYMAGPFLAMYARRNNRPELWDEDVFQAEMMHDKTVDPATGLWYHAWDADHQLPWADRTTGRSTEFWGRSIGWVPVALLLEAQEMPEGDPRIARLRKLTSELLHALLPWQDAGSGMWYQIVNRPEDPMNWPETSCTCLYTAALAMAVRLGWMDKGCMAQVRKGLDAVIGPMKRDQNGILLDGVCIGTSVGDHDFYCARPTSVNDLHGMGAYLLMCTEAAKTFEQLGMTY